MAECPIPVHSEYNFFDPKAASCPQPLYAKMLGLGPVIRTPPLQNPVISQYEHVIWALRHPEIFSSEMEMQMALGTERPMIPQQIDPPRQTRYRRLLDPHFSRKKMAVLVPSIRSHANALLDEFADSGACEFDSAFAIPLPCTAFLSLMGLPLSDLDTFLEFKDGIIRPQKFIEGADSMDLQKLMEEGRRIREKSGKGIYAYFERALAERRTKPRDDLLCSLLDAEIEGEKLSNTEILDVCFLMLLAGLDTVTATLGCNIAFLASNPEQRGALVRDPGLIPGAVEELLRWETPVSVIPRLVKQDVKLGDFEIKQGEMVTLLIGAANVDSSRFSDASTVDFERERNIHLAFGGGPHRCLGSHLARMELQVALEEWHRRIPEYAIQPGETPRFSPGIREVMYLPLVWEANR